MLICDFRTTSSNAYYDVRLGANSIFINPNATFTYVFEVADDNTNLKLQYVNDSTTAQTFSTSAYTKAQILKL